MCKWYREGQFKHKMRKWFKGCMALVIVLYILFIATGAYFDYISGEKLDSSTKWLVNLTPLILAVLGCFFKKEIEIWLYKRKSEAAAKIIGEFRICADQLIDFVDKSEVEGKYVSRVKEYIQECFRSSSQFPIQIRKELDHHFKEMEKLAKHLCGASRTINPLKGPPINSNIQKKAVEKLASVRSDLVNQQDFLDRTIGKYLEE